jgi:hypothetical protein
MGVSSPIFGATDKMAARRNASPAPGANAPAARLPLMFILTGLSALVVGMIWLMAQPGLLAEYHYNQQVIAVTHLFVLGWICSVVMGALYQLVPVALETKLYSEKLASWHFAFHTIGFIGMVCMFEVWNMKQVGHFGSMLGAGVGLYVYNIARTLIRAPRRGVTAYSVAAALFWIACTIAFGLSIAIAKCAYESTAGMAGVGGVLSLVSGLRLVAGYMAGFDAISAMHAHAHLGAVGFFMMLIVGVSYKLVPMFTLSEIQSHRRAIASVALLNVGLAGSFITILLRSTWKPVFALVLAVAVAIYLTEIAAIVHARKRPALDWGIKFFLTAIILLMPLSALGVLLSWPLLPLNAFTGQLENLYGFLGLFGVVTFAIVGMLYKIIPFLVWFGRYSQWVGRTRVPALADMYSARLQALGYWTYLSGLAVVCPAIMAGSKLGVRLGSVLLGFSIATLAINVCLILSHFLKRKSQPISFPSSVLARGYYPV